MPDLETLRRVFDGMSEPILYWMDGILEYENTAAAQLLPGGVSDELRGALEETVSTSLTIEGKLYFARTVSWDGGALAVLCPELDREGVELRLPLLLEDLRRQVNNLMAVAHLVTPALREGSGGKYDDYLSIMNQSFYRLLRLIQGSELAGEMAEGSVSFRPAALDLAGFCRDLCAQVQPLARLGGIEFSYDSALDTILTAGDEALLRRLALELVSNALRAAGAGGRAGLRLSKSGDRAILTVWDSGPGMDLAALDRADLSIKPEGGLRLGLTAARHIAALHGGAVMLESRSGEGTRATVSLPIRRPEPGMVRTPRGDPTGGFSPVLVALSEVLPYAAFRTEDLD